MNSEKFVIRVYGIAIHEGKLLVCDEYWFDTLMTKFPGGGLEYGEGPVDCLKRECMEEFRQEVRVLSHFYTTDYFQPARFIPGKQLISIYYQMEIPEPAAIIVSNIRNTFPDKIEGSMGFRWMSLEKMSEDDLTLAVDRHVFRLLQNREQGHIQ